MGSRRQQALFPFKKTKNIKKRPGADQLGISVEIGELEKLVYEADYL